MSAGKSVTESRDETIHLVYLRRETAARLQHRFWERSMMASSRSAALLFESFHEAFRGYLSGRASRIEIKQPGWWFVEVCRLAADVDAALEIGRQMPESE